MSLKIFYKIARDSGISDNSVEVKYFEGESEVSEEVYSFSSEEGLSHAISNVINEILSLNKSFIHYYCDKKNSYIELEDLMNDKKILISETKKFDSSNVDKLLSIKEFIL